MSLTQAQELEAHVPPALRAQVFQKRVEINKYRSDLLREAATLRPQNPSAATYQLDVQLYLSAVSNIEQQVADYEYCAWSQSPELYEAHLKLQEAAKLRQSSQHNQGPMPPGADFLGLPHNLSMVHHPNFRPSASIIPSEAPDYMSDSDSDDSFQSFYSAFTTHDDGSQGKPGQHPRSFSTGAVTGHGAPRPVPIPSRTGSSALSPSGKDHKNRWNKSPGYTRSPAPSSPMPGSPATKFDSPLDNVTPSMSPTGADSKDTPEWVKGGERSPKPALKRNQSPRRQPSSPAQSMAFHTPPSSPLKGSPGQDAASKATTSSRPSTPKSEMLTPQTSTSLPESPDRPSTSQHPQPSTTPPSMSPAAHPPNNNAPSVSTKPAESTDHTGGITLQVSATPYVAATPRITSPPSRASSSGLTEPVKPPPGLPTGNSKSPEKSRNPTPDQVDSSSRASPAASTGVPPPAADEAADDGGRTKTGRMDAGSGNQTQAVAEVGAMQATSVQASSTSPVPSTSHVSSTTSASSTTTACSEPPSSSDELQEGLPLTTASPVIPAGAADVTQTTTQKRSTPPNIQSGPQHEKTHYVPEQEQTQRSPKQEQTQRSPKQEQTQRSPKQEQTLLQQEEVSVPGTPTPGQPIAVGIVSPSSTISAAAQDFTTSSDVAAAPPALPTSAASQAVKQSTLTAAGSPAATTAAPLMSPADRDAVAEQVASEQTVLAPRLSGAFGTPVMSLNLDDKQPVAKPQGVLMGHTLEEEEEEALMPVQQQRLYSMELQGAAWDGASLVDGELLKKGLGPQLTSSAPATESRSASIAGWMAESSRVREAHTGRPTPDKLPPASQQLEMQQHGTHAVEPLVPAGGPASMGGWNNQASGIPGSKSNKSDIAAQMMATVLQAPRLPALEEDSVLSPEKAQEALHSRQRLLTGAMPVSPTFSTNSFEIDRQDLMLSSSQQRAEAAAKVLQQFASAKRGAVMMMPQDVLQGTGTAGSSKEAGKAGSTTDSDPAAVPEDTIQGPSSPMYVHTIFWPENPETPRTTVSVPPTDGAAQQKAAAMQPRPQAAVQENLPSSTIQPESALPPQLANLDHSGLERYRLANGDQLLVVREKANPHPEVEDTSSTSPVAHETMTTVPESVAGGISEFLWDPTDTDVRLASSINGDSNQLHGLQRQESGMSQSESQSASSSRVGTARMGMMHPTMSEDNNIRLSGEELVIGNEMFRLNDANDINMLFDLLRNSLLSRADDPGFTPGSAPGSAPVPHQPNSAISLPGSAPAARHYRSQSFDRNPHAAAPTHSMAPGREPLANRLFAALSQASHNRHAGSPAQGLPPQASNLLACLDEIVTPKNQDAGHESRALWNGHDPYAQSVRGLPQPPPPIRVPGGKLGRSSSAPGYHPLLPPAHFPMAAPSPNRPSLRDSYPVVNTMPVNQVPAAPTPAPILMHTSQAASSCSQLDPRATLLSAAARNSEQSTGLAQSWLSHATRPMEGLPPAGPLEVMRSSNSTTSTTMSHYMQRPQMSGASITSQMSSYVPETPSTAPTKIVLRESKGRWRSKKYVWQLVVGGEQQQTGEMTAGSEVATSGPSMVTSHGPPSIPDTAMSMSMSQECSPIQEVALEKKKKRGGGFKAAARLLKL